MVLHTNSLIYFAALLCSDFKKHGHEFVKRESWPRVADAARVLCEAAAALHGKYTRSLAIFFGERERAPLLSMSERRAAILNDQTKRAAVPPPT